MMYEMHGTNLSGVSRATRAKSDFWIDSFKVNRGPNCAAGFSSWQDVEFDRRGKAKNETSQRWVRRAYE
jgi:hypothetical protein